MPRPSGTFRAGALTLALLVAALVSAAPAGAQRVIVGEHVEEVFETPGRYPAPPGAPERSARLVWSDTIHFPGATYIAPHFERMALPPGDFVVVRSPDGEQIHRYERFGKRDLGRGPRGFFAAHVKGDTAIVELHARRGPNAGARGFGYRIDRYGRGYSDAEVQEMWDEGLGEKMNLRPPGLESIYAESICGVDDTEEATCYETSEPAAYEEARSVVRLLIDGNTLCTGWLFGCNGHVMTNQHCIGSQATADNVDFELMAEGGSCATDCRTTLGCPGTIEASSATLVAFDSGLDYALVLPDTDTVNGTDLNATYGYMQVRDTGPVLGERVYMPQHPAGWGKRIALESTHALDSGFVQVNSLTEPSCLAGGPTNGEAGYFGDTQGGSSGSPVLGYSDHRVVALHHCRGDVTCSGTGGEPNRGLPIDLVIADLGPALPGCAIEDCFPQPAVDAGPDRTLCVGEETTLGTPALADHSYSWSPGGASTARITVSPTATTSYTLTAATACRSASDTVVVAVDDGSGGLSEDFEGDLSGWTATGLWHAASSSACAPPGYASPTTAFYFGQDASCTYDTGTATSGTLTSPPISGILSTSTLSFEFFREVESYSASFDRTRVEVVTSAGSTTVFYLDATDLLPASWTSSGEISLARFAGLTLRIRFLFDTIDSVANSFVGWLIDDVVVTGESPCSGCPSHRTLANTTITGTDTFRASDIVSMGPSLVVDGEAIEVVAGQRVVIGSGVEIGGSFSAGTDAGACSPPPP